MNFQEMKEWNDSDGSLWIEIVDRWDAASYSDEILRAKKLLILKAEYDSNQYQRDRATAYPPVTDYLDGIVKGDTAQVDKYISDCQAVKLKYPKEVI